MSRSAYLTARSYKSPITTTPIIMDKPNKGSLQSPVYMCCISVIVALKGYQYGFVLIFCLMLRSSSQF